jgi:hypothetical protein
MGRIISFFGVAAKLPGPPSAAMIDEFEATMPSNNSTLFKQVLKQVAVLRKRPGGTGVWVLKSDFA